MSSYNTGNSKLNTDITVIPIDNTTLITTTPMSLSSRDPERKREDTLCRFIREYIYKIAQVIVAARRVGTRTGGNGLSESWNDLNAPYSQWFRIEMNDSQSIQKYIEEECIGNWDAKHNDFTLTIDISLSAEPLPQHVLLERWKIKFKRQHNYHSSHGSSSSINDPSLIYKRMTIQIRSILSYLRLLPTHSIVQSWEQSMAEQSMLMNINNGKYINKDGDIYGNDTMEHQQMNVTPFALYHLIYSHHNIQTNNINNFMGDTKSFCFEGLRTKFGTIRTTVFYGKDIRKKFEWLIRSVPGKNPPLFNDDLQEHIDSRSRYWDKKDHDAINNDNNHSHNNHINNNRVGFQHKFSSDSSNEFNSNSNSNGAHSKDIRSGSDRDIQQLRKSPNLSGSNSGRHNKHKPKNRLSKHLHSRNSPHRGPIRKQSSNSPHFELIPRSLERSGSGTLNPTAFNLDEQMVNIVNKQSPPIKSLALAQNMNTNNFHESPLLDTSTPKLDPQKEMEKIRLSTIFGSAPPVISLADVSTIKDDKYGSGIGFYASHNNNNNSYGSGSQLLDSIVREKQIISTRKNSKITIMKTLHDIEDNDNDNLNENNMNSDNTTNNATNGGALGLDAGDIFGDVARQLDQSIDSSMDMNMDESDHDDIQDEIFKGYDDSPDANSGIARIAKISEFINMCTNANKLQLKSFKNKDALLMNTELVNKSEDNNNNEDLSDSKKYFKLLSKHFEIRQERLIQLKRTSSTVLSNSIMRK